MKWTAMKDREPTKGRYLVYFKRDGKTLHKFGIIDWPGVWKSKKHWPNGCIVTHWMLLPKAPQ